MTGRKVKITIPIPNNPFPAVLLHQHYSHWQPSVTHLLPTWQHTQKDSPSKLLLYKRWQQFEIKTNVDAAISLSLKTCSWKIPPEKYSAKKSSTDHNFLPPSVSYYIAPRSKFCCPKFTKLIKKKILHRYTVLFLLVLLKQKYDLFGDVQTHIFILFFHSFTKNKFLTFTTSMSIFSLR